MKKTKLGSKVQKKTKELDENDVAKAKKQQLTQAKKRKNKISEKDSAGHSGQPFLLFPGKIHIRS